MLVPFVSPIGSFKMPCTKLVYLFDDISTSSLACFSARELTLKDTISIIVTIAINTLNATDSVSFELIFKDLNINYPYYLKFISLELY
ncbi:hypothetical protein [Campylobacter jejuni]|uniref:hypothetical protein n=1 Tax=Campylobacter jejuni TaxID=197 RepID=UPI00207D090E|nr:hypothetical protein [Campylobacter jejuni]